MHDGQVHRVDTAARTFWAVRFDGTNLQQVLDVASCAPVAPAAFGAVSLLSATTHPLVRLFDARTDGPCVVGVGDWVIADTDGILVLTAPWFDWLFGSAGPVQASGGRLDHIAELAAQLLDAATALQSTLAPAVASPRDAPAVYGGDADTGPAGAWGEAEQDAWAAGPNPFSAEHLTQVQAPSIGTPAVPRLHDVWMDRHDRTWTVVEEGACGSFWNSMCLGEDGSFAAWNALQAYYGPLRLGHRVVEPVAA